MLQSEIILERFRHRYAQDIDLTLRPAYFSLLAKLGSPHLNLPNVFHVAGTNGKGSTCAFLRAFLEAMNYRVHVYTSPHLVRFHERIRLAGTLIDESELTALLLECEALSEPGKLSYFEVATAVAFASFARHPADFVILEVGLGGRLDATNVIPKPQATLITRLSFDHRDFLGDTMAKIAFEKAGIYRKNVPCFSSLQPSAEAKNVLIAAAQKMGVPLMMEGVDWKVTPQSDGFQFQDAQRTLSLPAPALLGHHQYSNASLALAALTVLDNFPDTKRLSKGLKRVEWPARLQRINNGRLGLSVPLPYELWLDGGHNDSAGEVLAQQVKHWRRDNEGPLYVIMGMLKTKNPEEFLAPLKDMIEAVKTVTIPDEPLSLSADALAQKVTTAGLSNVSTANSLEEALRAFVALKKPGRILIVGSLYLAGHALRLNGRNE